MIIVAFIAIAVGVLLFVFTPLFANRETIAQASRRESRRRQLLEERERVYDAIRELEFDHRMGKVEDIDYQQTRTRYEAEAVELMQTLDKANGRADHPNRTPSAKDDDIEREISAIRRARSEN